MAVPGARTLRRGSKSLAGTATAAATVAQVTFHAFLEKMKNPAAADIVKSIKTFLAEFGASEPNADRDSQRVQV